MPSPLLSWVPCSGSARTAVLVAVGVVGAALLTGCETKSFLDPSEMGRYKKDPLVLPILSTLDTGVEEPNDAFVGAQPRRSFQTGSAKPRTEAGRSVSARTRES